MVREALPQQAVSKKYVRVQVGVSQSLEATCAPLMNTSRPEAPQLPFVDVVTLRRPFASRSPIVSDTGQAARAVPALTMRAAAHVRSRRCSEWIMSYSLNVTYCCLSGGGGATPAPLG